MTEQAPEHGVTWTEAHMPVSSFILDIGVNPRIGDDSWVRRVLGQQDRNGTYPGYNPDLLGAFTISERQDGTFVILDGANRRRLLELAGDLDRVVLCQIAHGMTRQQEAAHARGINERRSWTPVRKFLTDASAGDPEAVFIVKALAQNGWTVEINGNNGTLRGVVPLQKLIRTCELQAVKQARLSRTKKDTEQYRAALMNGRDTGHRLLEEAVSAVSAAWPVRDSPYTANIIYGVGLVLLRDGRHAKIDRMGQQLMMYPGGKRTIIRSARNIRDVHKAWREADAIASLVIEQYNHGLSSRSADRLEPVWTPIAV